MLALELQFVNTVTHIKTKSIHRPLRTPRVIILCDLCALAVHVGLTTKCIRHYISEYQQLVCARHDAQLHQLAHQLCPENIKVHDKKMETPDRKSYYKHQQQ